MNIASLLAALIIFGVTVWLINTYVPMAPPIKTVINVIIVLVLCLWLLSLLGIGNVPIRLFK